MWLDRFSTYSTPSSTPPQSRSPAPGRRQQVPFLPPRPGFNPRSSSLSLASRSSSNSSLPVSKLPNGSGLRHEVVDTPPPDGPAPLEALEGILGSPLRAKHNGKEIEELDRPDDLQEDINFGGLSLQAFAEEDFEDEEDTFNVHTYSTQSVEEYDRESDKFEDLHRSILGCDDVLKSVQTYLTNFQADLGVVSAEIETLQTRSVALSTKLKNREVVEKRLGPSVEEISISPMVVRKIAEGSIDENFARALAELEKRTKIVESRSKEQSQSKALEDALPFYKDLTNKAIERIRDYLVLQIKALRSPNINAQIIQLQAFMRFKDLYSFLAKHQKQLADEICQAYVNTMRWYYSNHFLRYQKALEKLKVYAIDKSDTIVADDNSKRGALSRGQSSQYDQFLLGRRIDVLRHPSHAAISAYLAEEDKSSHYLDVPFRAFNRVLIDNASFEYTFLTTFFSPAQSYHAISRTFQAIFESSFANGQSLTKQLIDTSTDALGILLCVRLNQSFAFELQRRKVPAVEGYINATNMLLWPRFQVVMDLQSESVRRASSSLPNRAPSSTSSILTSSSSMSSASAAVAAAQTTAPHPLTQKFANFLHGVVALSSEAGDDEPVSNSLGRLRAEFEAYLTKLSKAVADARKRERFLHNNYSLIGTILEDLEGKYADEMKAHFKGLRDAFGKGGS